MQTASILARGYYGQNRAKTAHGLIRHGRRYRILNVIDETMAGEDAGEALGLGKLGIPIVDDIQPGADVLIIGVAPAGGKLPVEWKEDIKTAIGYDMDVVSGLHDFLNDEAELVKLAQEHHVALWDVRAPPPADELLVATGKKSIVPVVLSYGTDASVGKRTTLLEMHNAALELGVNAGFVATGQTGILIGCDAGIVVDRLPADFVAGAVERMVLKVANSVACQKFRDSQGEESPWTPLYLSGGGTPKASHKQIKKERGFKGEILLPLDIPNNLTSSNSVKELIFVEGQGSLLHHAYSTSAVGILHGAQPDYIVVTHDPSREYRGSFPEVKMPELEQELKVINLLSPTSKVIGIALNCQKTEDWRGVIKEYKTKTGLLTVDVLNQNDGGSQLVKKIIDEIKS